MNDYEKLIQDQIDKLKQTALAPPDSIDHAPKTSYQMKQRVDRIQANIRQLKRNDMKVRPGWDLDVHWHEAPGFDKWECSRTDCNKDTRISWSALFATTKLPT